jgi:hypothetical protein
MPSFLNPMLSSSDTEHGQVGHTSIEGSLTLSLNSTTSRHAHTFRALRSFQSQTPTESLPVCKCRWPRPLWHRRRQRQQFCIYTGSTYRRQLSAGLLAAVS